jgi:putative ABC transport system permease protein
VLRVGASGPRARKLRTALSALGVSIGIAAMVGVLGLSESSKSALLDEISALGTNLLTVEAVADSVGATAHCPRLVVGTIERVPTVEVTSAVYDGRRLVLKNEFVDEGQTGGLGVVAADDGLVDTLNGELAFGVVVRRDDRNVSDGRARLGRVRAARRPIARPADTWSRSATSTSR